MLPKINRLPLGKTKLTTTKTCYSSFFMLKIAKTEQHVSRFGVIVSKKIDKRAVVRNKLRRIVYSIFSDFLKTLPEGYDILVILRKNINTEDKFELKEMFEQCLRREKILT